MDKNTRPSNELIAVWESMASHFLDTETRQDIPRTALLCIESGFGVEQAYEVWQHDVSPAVSFNLWDIAGQWAGWDRDWLVERIVKTRRTTRGPLAYARYRLEIHFGHGTWLSMARVMQTLLAAAPADRRQLTSDLACLASHYFDCCPEKIEKLEPAARERIKALVEPAFHVFDPASFGEQRQAMRERVTKVLP